MMLMVVFRVLARAVFGTGEYDHGQFDYMYDDHGNLTDFRSTTPQMPDLNRPSTAEVWMGTSYVNEFDSAGRLLASNATTYGPGNSSAAPTRTTFQEDAEGRCERLEIERDGKNDCVELRGYDAAGRVHTIEQRCSGGDPSLQRWAAVQTVIEYDDVGRILSSTLRGAGEHETSQDLPFSTVGYEYAADGGVRIETIDYTTDLPNAEIEVNGQSVHVGRRIETRTAACASIEAQIARTWIRIPPSAAYKRMRTKSVSSSPHRSAR